MKARGEGRKAENFYITKLKIQIRDERKASTPFHTGMSCEYLDSEAWTFNGHEKSTTERN